MTSPRRPLLVRAAALLGAAAACLAAAGAGASDAPAPGRDAGASRADVVPPVLDDVEHMCALLTGCDRLPLPPGLVPRDFPACVRTLMSELSSPQAVTFSLTLRECGLRSSSCGELRTCALRGARAEVCRGRGRKGAVELCDAEGRAVTCVDERVALVRDCPRGGEHCVLRGGKAVCALGPCDADAPPSCSASGTRVVECSKGKLESLDCAAFGLRCEASPEGPRCATSGARCSGAARCEGATAVTCFRDHEVRVDCAAAGLSCGGDAGSSVGACAAPPAAECDPASRPRCDGATLRWCAWGKPRAYLCKSMGLSRCVQTDKGARCAG